MEPELETKVLPEPVDTAALGGANSRQFVGRYELLQRLGYGGMATVYLARARGLAGFEKLVAVKVIHPHLAAEPEFVQMFLNEARIAALLSNPHVGEVLDVGEDDGLYFMVMEYIEGETLSSLLRSVAGDDNNRQPNDRARVGRLPFLVALQVVADACAGLSAVHELCGPDGTPLALVHRDVSPQNLLITRDGWVKLVDFGIVKATGYDPSTLTGHLRGKLPYMAPEQARGESLSRATDVFALGAILWELCAGRRLFAGKSDAQTLANVMACKIPPLGQGGESVPASITAIVERALARDPADRYPTATAMLEDVRESLQTLLRQQTTTDTRTLDPREQLADAVHRHFGAQLAYRRAAARRTGPAPVVSLVASSGGRVVDPGAHTEPGTPTRSLSVVGSDPHPSADSGPSSSSGAQIAIRTNESAGLVSAERPMIGMSFTGHEDPQNLTVSRPPPRRRSLGLWVALPLVGAAVAILALRLTNQWGAAKASEPDPVIAERDATPADAASKTPLTSAAQEHVIWYVHTTPAGAAVRISGLPEELEAHVATQLSGHVTPVQVTLPRHREPVTVLAELPGFQVSQRTMMPVRDENVSLELRPVPGDTGGPEGQPEEGTTGEVKSVAVRHQQRPSRLKFRHRDRNPKTKPDATDSVGGSEPTGDSGDSGPELPPEPTFKPLKPRTDSGG